jgi:hypothetical protein
MYKDKELKISRIFLSMCDVKIFLTFTSPNMVNSRYKSKNDADEAVSVVTLTSSSGGYINARNSANLELLIDKTSSKTFDFSTLYTTLPHNRLKTRLKETIHKVFSHRNYGPKCVVGE